MGPTRVDRTSLGCMARHAFLYTEDRCDTICLSCLPSNWRIGIVSLDVRPHACCRIYIVVASVQRTSRWSIPPGPPRIYTTFPLSALASRYYREWLSDSPNVLIRAAISGCNRIIQLVQVDRWTEIFAPSREHGVKLFWRCLVADGFRCHIQTCECIVESSPTELTRDYPENLSRKVRWGRIAHRQCLSRANQQALVTSVKICLHLLLRLMMRSDLKSDISIPPRNRPSSRRPRRM